MIGTWLLDLSANNPAYRSTPDRAYCAAASEDGSPHRTDTRTDGGIFITLRHA